MPRRFLAAVDDEGVVADVDLWYRSVALAMGDELLVVPTGRRQLEGAQLLVLSRADDTHSNGGEHQAPGEQLGQAKQHLRHLGPDGLLDLLWRLAWPVGDDDQGDRLELGEPLEQLLLRARVQLVHIALRLAADMDGHLKRLHQGVFSSHPVSVVSAPLRRQGAARWRSRRSAGGAA
mgnify:FL=1